MLARARQLGCEAETLALGALGRRRALRGETDEAKRLLAEAVRRVETIDARLGIAVNLDLLADVASSEGNDRLTVRLGAAAADLLDELGAPFPARRRLQVASFALPDTAGLEPPRELPPGKDPIKAMTADDILVTVADGAPDGAAAPRGSPSPSLPPRKARVCPTVIRS